ncbi:unnamed protein product [Ilex paraguariensis]|uniref:Uncharacterized protein n=1 Tax=Ilex paraguariensis TaxID=185542 RepID=A0ABC8QUM8_9AQUA
MGFWAKARDEKERRATLGWAALAKGWVTSARHGATTSVGQTDAIQATGWMMCVAGQIALQAGRRRSQGRQRQRVLDLVGALW